MWRRYAISDRIEKEVKLVLVAANAPFWLGSMSFSWVTYELENCA